MAQRHEAATISASDGNLVIVEGAVRAPGSLRRAHMSNELQRVFSPQIVIFFPLGTLLCCSHTRAEQLVSCLGRIRRAVNIVLHSPTSSPTA